MYPMSGRKQRRSRKQRRKKYNARAMRRPPHPSVEVRRQVRTFRMLKHSVDLCGGGSSQRQRRQRVARKKRHLAGLVAGAGGASGDFPDEKQFINRVHVASRGVAPLNVVPRLELEGPALQSRPL